MGQRRRGRRLAETIAPQRLSGVASSVGGGADAVMNRPEQEDEQRLRETLCERRSVRVRYDDSPHDEAARLSLRTFHTASLRTRVNKPSVQVPFSHRRKLGLAIWAHQAGQISR